MYHCVFNIKKELLFFYFQSQHILCEDYKRSQNEALKGEYVRGRWEPEVEKDEGRKRHLWWFPILFRPQSPRAGKKNGSPGFSTSQTLSPLTFTSVQPVFNVNTLLCPQFYNIPEHSKIMKLKKFLIIIVQLLLISSPYKKLQ